MNGHTQTYCCKNCIIVKIYAAKKKCEIFIVFFKDTLRNSRSEIKTSNYRRGININSHTTTFNKNRSWTINSRTTIFNRNRSWISTIIQSHSAKTDYESSTIIQPHSTTYVLPHQVRIIFLALKIHIVNVNTI